MQRGTSRTTGYVASKRFILMIALLMSLLLGGLAPGEPGGMLTITDSSLVDTTGQ